MNEHETLILQFKEMNTRVESDWTKYADKFLSHYVATGDDRYLDAYLDLVKQKAQVVRAAHMISRGLPTQTPKLQTYSLEELLKDAGLSDA